MAECVGPGTGLEVQGFKSHSDHSAGVVSWWTLVLFLSHGCKSLTGLSPTGWDF